MALILGSRSVGAPHPFELRARIRIETDQVNESANSCTSPRPSLHPRFRRLKVDRRCVAINCGYAHHRIKLQDFHATRVIEFDQPVLFEERERATHRLNRQCQIIGNMLPLHRQLDDTSVSLIRTLRERREEPSPAAFPLNQLPSSSCDVRPNSSYGSRPRMERP